MQERQILPNGFRYGSLDPLHGIQGVDRLVFLEVYFCQTEDGFVAYRLLYVALDNRRDGPAGTQVHPVCQFEITHSKLGMVDVVIKGIQFGFIDTMVLCQLGVESGDGIEPVLLKGVVKRLSEIKILQHLRSRCTGRSRRHLNY